MSDPRLQEWLQLSERILGSQPAERAAELVAAEQRRAELQASLKAEPPPVLPSRQLADALRRSEETLQELASGLREELATRLEELRRVRSGTHGYRPTRGSRPAFVSRSV